MKFIVYIWRNNLIHLFLSHVVVSFFLFYKLLNLHHFVRSLHTFKENVNSRLTLFLPQTIFIKLIILLIFPFVSDIYQHLSLEFQWDFIFIFVLWMGWPYESNTFYPNNEYNWIQLIAILVECRVVMINSIDFIN